MRLFVAAEITRELRDRALRLIEQLQGPGARVRWVDIEKMHVTLRYLGQVDRSGDSLSWEASCNQNGMQSTMKGSVTLHSDTHYTSVIDMTMPGNQMVSTSEGKWASSDCPE